MASKTIDPVVIETRSATKTFAVLFIIYPATINLF